MNKQFYNYGKGAGWILAYLYGVILVMALVSSLSVSLLNNRVAFELYSLALAVVSSVCLGFFVINQLRAHFVHKPASREAYMIALGGSFRNQLKKIMGEFKSDNFVRGNNANIFHDEIYKLLDHAKSARIPRCIVETDIKAVAKALKGELDFTQPIEISILSSGSWLIKFDFRKID